MLKIKLYLNSYMRIWQKHLSDVLTPSYHRNARYCTCSIHSQQILCDHTRPYIRGFHQGINGFSKSVLSHTDKEDQKQIQINSVCLLTETHLILVFTVVLIGIDRLFCLSHITNMHLLPTWVINYHSLTAVCFSFQCCRFIVMNENEG